MQDPEPAAAGGLFTKDRFDVNLIEDTVTCPAGVSVEIRPQRDGGGLAYFADACASCPLRPSAPPLSAGAPSASVPTKKRLPEPEDASATPVARRLPRHTSEGRAKARPPHAPKARWPPSSGPRHREGRRRLQPARRGDEPGTSRRARRAEQRRRGVGRWPERHMPLFSTFSRALPVAHRRDRSACPTIPRRGVKSTAP